VNVEIAKYRCDSGPLHPVSALRLYVAKNSRPLAVALPAQASSGHLDYCRAASGASSSDPGNTVEIGPYARGSAHGIN
jgi:hypothetical protein